MRFKEGLRIGLFAAIMFLFVVLFAVGIDYSDKKEQKSLTSDVPRIGQKLWVYHMNDREWYNYVNQDYKYDKKGVIILQLQQDPEVPDITSYHLLSENSQVSNSPLFLAEGSSEFIKDKKLYTYYPRTFEFSEVLFNGYNFTLNKLNEKSVAKLFNGHRILKMSDFKNNVMNLTYDKKHSKYIIINDIGDDFYMYYVIPNDNKKLKLGDFSNQFKVNDAVSIRLQRLEGCTKAYPCYDINIVK